MSKVLRFAAALSIAAGFSLASASAAFLTVDLPGNSYQDDWSGMTAPNYPGYPTYVTSTNSWPAAIASTSTVGDGGLSFNKTAGLGFPSEGGGIYVGGLTSGTGSFRISSPVDGAIAGLETVVFQIDIEGVGADWATIFTGLNLDYNGGSQGLTGFDSYVVSAVQTGIQFGQPAFRYTLAFQWDLTSIVVPITSFNIDWTAAEHSLTYGLQVNQGDTMSAVPEPSTYALVGASLLVGLLGYRRRLRKALP